MTWTLLDSFCRFVFLLTAGHALADRPLQEGYIRTEKYAPRGVPGDYRWIYGLACHCLIHGGLVALVTGFWWLGVAELVAHATIDNAKCTGKIGLVVDQLLHLACKLAWAGIALAAIY